MGLMLQKVGLLYQLLAFDHTDSFHTQEGIFFTIKYESRVLLLALLLDDVWCTINIKPNIGLRTFPARKKANKDTQIYARYANTVEVKNAGRAVIALCEATAYCTAITAREPIFIFGILLAATLWPVVLVPWCCYLRITWTY